jgi:hypothetical protein
VTPWQLRITVVLVMLRNIFFSYSLHIEWKSIRHKLPALCFLAKNTQQTLCTVCPGSFSFRDIPPRWMAQDDQRSNRECLLVTRILHAGECRLVRMCAPRLVVWIQLIMKLYFEDSHLLKTHLSCDNAWSSPLREYHSCNYGIFFGWCS